MQSGRNSPGKDMSISSEPGGDPSSTDTGLIAGVKRLDPVAWRQLVVLYGPLIYGWARRSGLRNEDAADVTQDVFRAVASGVTNFGYGRPGDTFRGWLWTVTQNKIRDFWRNRAARPLAAGGTDAQELLLLVAEGDQGSHSGSSADSNGLLRRAVELVRAEFESRSWSAFWQSTIEGRAAGDVATELGMTANAVYVARSRILRRLRDLLAGDGPAGSHG